MTEANKVMNIISITKPTESSTKKAGEKFIEDPNFSKRVNDVIEEIESNGYKMMKNDETINTVAFWVYQFDKISWNIIHPTTDGITDFSQDSPQVVELLRRVKEMDKAVEMFFDFLTSVVVHFAGKYCMAFKKD